MVYLNQKKLEVEFFMAGLQSVFDFLSALIFNKFKYFLIYLPLSLCLILTKTALVKCVARPLEMVVRINLPSGPEPVNRVSVASWGRMAGSCC